MIASVHSEWSDFDQLDEPFRGAGAKLACAGTRSCPGGH
jgi:hypothetical protein